MLKAVNKKSIEELMRDIIPEDVIDNKGLDFNGYNLTSEGLSELDYLKELRETMEMNKY